MQSLKDLTLTVSKKEAVFFFLNEKICQLSALNMCENKKKYWYIHDLFAVINKLYNISI